jgi:hypothetical protein
MTSTYSPALQIEEMATGDQSGTWGDTTNNNFLLFEQAITGVVSIAQGDATLTLTVSNGAVDQARNAVINLTGAMTTGRNVIVPTSNKLYLFKNSTTGGFATTIKTVAGSGVAIAAGTSQWVYCDGTNVVQGLSGTLSSDVNNNLALNNFLDGYATTATAASTTTLTVASAYLQFFTGSTTQIVAMPVTSTLVLGQAFKVVNQSSGAVTINSSGGNAIVVLAAGTASTLTCTAITGTTAASWSATYSGTAVTSGKLLTISNSLTLAGTDGKSLTLSNTGTLAGGDAWVLAIAAAKTLTVSNTLTLAGTDSTTMTFPSSSAAVAALDLAAQTVTGGAKVTTLDLGTVTTGTTTLAPGSRPLQKMVNGGASTLTMDANDGSMILEVTNNGSAGTLTLTFDKVVGAFDTTNGHEFRCSCSKVNAKSLLIIQPMF